ncbi:hypothetical protein B0H16DRAFT_1881825 [Mycena metata]|uniref:NmrA-like domain-containing protein n=1 Tax=Mycena metata TaxID=1033252 RepID=A0AAD7JUW8_9AGAR|nr:hypothetical protein B0H16DRAFT_1881825 [Mycena metata]
MASARIVSVFGATGIQGSAVVGALLKQGTFTPRAITRNPDSEASQKLKARGVEVAQANSLDKASLVRALRGSEAVYAVTLPSFPPVEGKDEVTQGKNMIDAAKEVGVKFFVWPSVPSVKKVSGGKYQNCTQYDHKEIVAQYLKTSGLPHAILLIPAFLENYWKHNHLKKTDTGYDVALPQFPATSLQNFVWVERDLPAATITLLKNYTDASKGILGKEYPVITGRMTYAELTARTAKVLGAEVSYTITPPTGMKPVDEMWAFLAEYNGYYTTPIANPDLVALGMKFGTIDEFLEVEVRARYGSAVVDALLKEGTFTPRAITRDSDSGASQKLKARGVQVVQADSLDKASLVSALNGSEAVFALTVPHFPHEEGKDEITQGRNMIDAAKEVGVKFFIWTSLPSIKKVSGGKYQTCTQYDHKEIVAEYLKTSGLPHAILLLPAFLENYWKFGSLKKTDTGYDVAMPQYPATSLQTFVWIERDVPAATLALLKNYTDASKEINGKEYPVVTGRMTYAELAAKTAKVLGVEVTYTTAPATGFPPIDEMWAFLAEYDGYFTTPIPNPDLVALGMEFRTVDEFLEVEVKARYGQ